MGTYMKGKSYQCTSNKKEMLQVFFHILLLVCNISALSSKEIDVVPVSMDDFGFNKLICAFPTDVREDNTLAQKIREVTLIIKQ